MSKKLIKVMDTSFRDGFQSIYGAKVLVDGAQLTVHSKVDVSDFDIDFYAFSGHKIYAPRGIAGLFSKK